ncbi:8949_t:CDS:2, partial [Cetraspora pellucida]
AKFHIGLIPQRWYLDTLVEDVLVLLEPAIVAGLNSQSDVYEYNSHVDFSHLEHIRGKHVFSKSVRNEMMCRLQWEKGFGIMKKTLNLAIITNRTNELYKIHENFTKEMELELIKKNNETEHNDPEEFACTISNPISVRTKGRKSKRIKGFNNNMNISKGKNKKKQIPQVEYNKLDNDNDVNYKGEGSNVKEKKGVKKCGICNSKGHNACTCPGLAVSNSSEDNSEDDDSEEDNSEGIDSEGNNSEEISIKRKCGI